MKKIIILAIATLSTGIVLSNTLNKKEVSVKPVSVQVQKSADTKDSKAPSFDAVSSAD